MGWAARQKQADRAAGRRTTAGNPEAFVPKATVISEEKFQEQQKTGARHFPVRFSDRRYVMDAHGTLRRVSSVPTVSVSVTRA